MDKKYFTEQDEKIRNRFIEDFQHLFKKIIPAHIDSSIDILATGLTGNIFRLELKERFYDVDFIADDCYMMPPKYYFFKGVYKFNPKEKLVYFNYCRDGYIAYNLTKRFETNSPDLQLIPTNVPVTNLDNKIKRLKVCHLQFNPEMGDKKVYYKKDVFQR